MRSWIIENALCEEETLLAVEAEAKVKAQEARKAAWEKYITPIKAQVQSFIALASPVASLDGADAGMVNLAIRDLQNSREPLRRDILKAGAMILLKHKHLKATAEVAALQHYYDAYLAAEKEVYNTYLHATGVNSALNVPVVPAAYEAESITVNGYEILNKYFDQLFSNNPRVFAFGEDVGKIGDVNQGFAGLQQKHGKVRIADTGIRELTIMGQGIGMALRGLRPIAEIQYLDYLLYGLQPLSDDVASLQYRTKGIMHCPLIVRTRGHRLEGIWHSGSPMGMIINSLRGIHVCVPRNMVQAAGMYNTLLQANEPALVIESLNGYRLKEKLPANLETYTVPLGIPEILHEGTDVTIVTYGSMTRIVEEAMVTLQEQVIENQGGYRWLDVAPRTMSAQAHRPAYGSDGDYFSKPNTEDVVKVIMEMMQE
ncbi:hypothetical protein HA402_012233 [Bradysia odoriphaga]|nr:hypothetical protein HA402_012233 [Bradysia odoriphaga]